MTPAVDALDALNIDYELLHYETKVGPDLAQTVAQELGIQNEQVFKTLVTESDAGDLFVVLVPAAVELNLKKLAAALGVKKMKMADQRTAERSSGYLKGAISPIGQRTKLPTYIDASADQYAKIYVSGGKRGVELGISSRALVEVCDAKLMVLTS